MTMFVFAALTVSAVIWAITAPQSSQDSDGGRDQSAHRVGFRPMRHSQQEQLAMEATGPESGWSITETGAAPGWSITSAHLRMW